MSIRKATSKDDEMIEKAIEEAQIAIDNGKVGVGAVLTWHDEILDVAHNMYEETRDITAHAEMVLLRTMARRLDAMSEEEKKGLTLYSTLQPCLMCFSAISFAGIKRVVYAALNEDGQQEVQITRDIPIQTINQALVRGPIELVAGVRREEGKELLKRMGKQGK